MTPARHRHLAAIRACDPAPPIAPTPATVLYFVICQFKDGRAVVERDVTRMTRSETIDDLRRRELVDVVSIIETEFTDHGLSSRDVTASMILEAELMRGLVPDPVDRQAAAFDHAQDHRKNWSV